MLGACRIKQRNRLRQLVVLALAIALVGCGGDADRLWGRDFVSSQISGAPESLEMADSNVQVEFVHESGGFGWVSVELSCNELSATVHPSGDRLVTDAIITTDMGCDGLRQEQDDWLSEFFAADPMFEFSGDELTLTSDDAVLQLQDTNTV